MSKESKAMAEPTMSKFISASITSSSLEDSDSPAFPDSGDNASLNSAFRSIREFPLTSDPEVSILTNTSNVDKTLSELSSGTAVPNQRQTVNRKESYKAQRKSYAREKKRVERELLSTLKDQSIIVLADWLKVRGSLKSWTKMWCVLKPGLLLLYRSQKAKSNHWIGTIILSTCELIERPSKKDGFCFKLFHPMDQNIWASRGPDGEARGAVVQPLPTSHLIFRAPNNAAGKCWMDALELALRCSSLLLRTMSSQVSKNEMRTMNESDVENHFHGVELTSDGQHEEEEEEDEGSQPPLAGSDESDYSEDTPSHDGVAPPPTPIVSTNYVSDPSQEVFGTAGDQTEEFSDENKSIVWFLVKQVRPGMDLSKVVLPTFILEPRSFLDKLTDYHYHNDIIAQAIHDESPYNRMKTIVKWYLSGFYKKPKGLKKPYNPILGETFRCYWQHPSGSKTFYIAEQVSHHPPISAFYVANRQEGFTISSSILAKSKFYGNSTSAILEGTATLTLLPRGEEYRLTMPYAHCKGILMGTMTMELGGKVTIECVKTGYSAEMEFKLRPFLGGGEFTNAVSGKIRLGKETLATLDGHWDDTVHLMERKSGTNGSQDILWQVTPEIRQARLRRFVVPLEDQMECESVKLWAKVSKAIENDDQNAATEEKTILEEAQRAGARERKVLGKEWIPKHFQLNPLTNQYEYKHADLRPWDPLNDEHQYEYDFVIKTKTKHSAPMVRTQSIISVGDANDRSLGKSGSPIGHERSPINIKNRRRRNTKERIKLSLPGQESGSTIPEESDSNENGNANTSKRLQNLLQPLEDQQKTTNEKLTKLQHQLEVMMYQQKERDSNSNINRDMVLLVLLVVMIQAVMTWVMTHKAQQQQQHNL